MTVDEQLHLQMESVLDAFSGLKGVFPDDWPRHPKYKVTDEQLAQYAEDRTHVFRDQLNFPLLLHNLCQLESEDAPGVFYSMVAALDWFAEQMGSLPGAVSVLKPLWQDPWSPQPRFWEVLSVVLVTRDLVNKGFQVSGFGRPMDDGTEKDADIETEFRGRRVWIDVEASSLTKTVADAGGGFRNLVSRRAQAKMNKKFSEISSEDRGVVASVYRPLDDNYQLFDSTSDDLDDIPSAVGEHVFAKIYWLHVSIDSEGRRAVILSGRLTSEADAGGWVRRVCRLIARRWCVSRSP